MNVMPVDVRQAPRASFPETPLKIEVNTEHPHRHLKHSSSKSEGEIMFMGGKGRIPRELAHQLTTSSKSSKAALAAVLPLENTTRYQAGWSNTPTSVASPFIVETIDFSEPAHANAELASGGFFAALSRDPLNAYIEYVPNPTAKPFSYGAGFATTAIGDADKTVTISPHLQLYNRASLGFLLDQKLNVATFSDQNIGSSAHLHPHGPIMFPRTPSGSTEFKFVYMTKGEAFEAALENATHVPSVNHWTLVVYRWDGETATPVANITPPFPPSASNVFITRVSKLQF